MDLAKMNPYVAHDRIKQYVRSKPGASLTEIQAEFEARSAGEMNVLNDYLNVLVADHRLAQRKLDGVVRYFPADYVENPPEEVFSAKIDRISRFVRENPGSTSSEVGRALGMTTSDITGRLASLVDKNKVKRTRVNDELSYYPPEATMPGPEIPVNRRHKPGKPPFISRRQRIIDFLKEHPGATLVEIRAVLPDVPAKRVTSTLSALKYSRVLSGKPSPDGLKYYLETQVDKPVQTVQPPAEIDRMAKDFYWETQSDSLREFLKWAAERDG